MTKERSEAKIQVVLEISVEFTVRQSLHQKEIEVTNRRGSRQLKPRPKSTAAWKCADENCGNECSQPRNHGQVLLQVLSQVLWWNQKARVQFGPRKFERLLHGNHFSEVRDQSEPNQLVITDPVI